MPYDGTTCSNRGERVSLRGAVLDLMARSDPRSARDDAAFRAALVVVVARTRDRADDLWLQYRGDRADVRAMAYARYGY